MCYSNNYYQPNAIQTTITNPMQFKIDFTILDAYEKKFRVQLIKPKYHEKKQPYISRYHNDNNFIRRYRANPFACVNISILSHKYR